MIGNLILALGVAICCGAPLATESQLNIQRVSGGNTAISNVSDDEGYLYFADTFTFAPYTSPNYYAVYGGRISNRTSYTYYTLHATAESLTYYASCAIASAELSTNYVGDGEYDFEFLCVGEYFANNYWLCRFFFSMDSPVENIEILPSNNNAKFGFGYGGFGALLGNGVAYDSWIQLRDSRFTSGLTLNYYGEELNKFMDYYFIFQSDSSTNTTFTINLFGSLNAGYQQGYDVGYSNGYDSGISTGFSNGYAEGLRVGSSSSSTAIGLFGAIADTPIRFLKQMFSFELFGMNVAVIILSCLTAVILFGIVKKVWK